MADIHDDATVRRIASGLLETLAKPFEFIGREICVTLSIGVSLFPWDGDTVEDLLNKADLTMYRAKGSGKNQCAFYSDRYEFESLPGHPWHGLRAQGHEISAGLSAEDEAKLQAIRQRAAKERDARQAGVNPHASRRRLLGRLKGRWPGASGRTS